ncbi:MAG: histidine phosphatase family protein [Patescibacteria group bacterium]
MKKIYLARHGQDEDNVLGILNGHRDQPLSALGEQQVHNFAKQLKELNLGIKKIYCSPLQRAYTTALEVTKILELEDPEKNDLLIERDFGILTGQPSSNIDKFDRSNIIQSASIAYFLEAEGAETFPQLIERAKKILLWLENTDKHDTILLVCHGDIGKMIYSAFYKIDWKQALTEFDFSNTEVILLEDGARKDERIVYQAEIITI